MALYRGRLDVPPERLSAVLDFPLKPFQFLRVLPEWVKGTGRAAGKAVSHVLLAITIKPCREKSLTYDRRYRRPPRLREIPRIWIDAAV